MLPRGIAHELLITCREMLADEAYRLGFANRLTQRGGALQESLKLAGMIVRNSMAVVREVKRGLATLAEDGVGAATKFEWDAARALQGGSDAEEGISAFLEKRPPKFA